MGDPECIRRLHGPDVPDSVAYLLALADKLAGMRTVGPHGVNGFTPEMIESFARLYEIPLLPHEVDALFTLDTAMRFPDADSPGEDET